MSDFDFREGPKGTKARKAPSVQDDDDGPPPEERGRIACALAKSATALACIIWFVTLLGAWGWYGINAAERFHSIPEMIWLLAIVNSGFVLGYAILKVGTLFRD